MNPQTTSSAKNSPSDVARGPRLFGEPRPRRARPPVRGGEKYAVLKAIARELTTHSLPPMDEGVKSILASQVGTLLKGGYGLELVQRVAIATALSWDERRGHTRLTHLAQRIRLIDADEHRARHEQQKALEREAPDPRIAAILARGGRPHPNAHPFQRSNRPNTCATCEGPIGVHVRVIGLDDDGNGVVVSTGVA